MVYKQNTFLYQKFRFRAISPSSRYAVEGIFCVIWTSLEPYRTDLERFYPKHKKKHSLKNYLTDDDTAF